MEDCYTDEQGNLKIISRSEALALGLKKYYNGRLCKHGHRSQRLVDSHNCYQCVLERAKAKSKTEEHRAKKRKWDKNRYNWQQHMHIWKNCKNRAAKRGLEFSIDPEDIVIPETCPVLGIPLSVGSKGFDPNSPSVDRIDCNKGYTKDNIAVISMRANRLKSDAQLEEIKAIVKYMEGLAGAAIYDHESGRLNPLETSYEGE